MWLEKHNVSGRCNPVRMSICHTTFIIGAQTLDIVNQSQECWEKIEERLINSITLTFLGHVLEMKSEWAEWPPSYIKQEAMENFVFPD